MNLSRSSDCFVDSPTFLAYILDNLFSFCHKDDLLAWSIENRVAWLEVGGALRLRLEAVKRNIGNPPFQPRALSLAPYAIRLSYAFRN